MSSGGSRSPRLTTRNSSPGLRTSRSPTSHSSEWRKPDVRREVAAACSRSTDPAGAVDAVTKLDQLATMAEVLRVADRAEDGEVPRHLARTPPDRRAVERASRASAERSGASFNEW